MNCSISSISTSFTHLFCSVHLPFVGDASKKTSEVAVMTLKTWTAPSILLGTFSFVVLSSAHIVGSPAAAGLGALICGGVLVLAVLISVVKHTCRLNTVSVSPSSQEKEEGVKETATRHYKIQGEDSDIEVMDKTGRDLFQIKRQEYGSRIKIKIIRTAGNTGPYYFYRGFGRPFSEERNLNPNSSYFTLELVENRFVKLTGKGETLFLDSIAQKENPNLIRESFKCFSFSYCPTAITKEKAIQKILRISYLNFEAKLLAYNECGVFVFGLDKEKNENISFYANPTENEFRLRNHSAEARVRIGNPSYQADYLVGSGVLSYVIGDEPDDFMAQWYHQEGILNIFLNIYPATLISSKDIEDYVDGLNTKMEAAFPPCLNRNVIRIVNDFHFGFNVEKWRNIPPYHAAPAQ